MEYNAEKKGTVPFFEEAFPCGNKSVASGNKSVANGGVRMVERHENMKRLAGEILGEDIEPGELEKLARRLEALSGALDDLAHLVTETNEPLTMAALEDD